eukprot:434105-Pleurochrysis_carterae.AAC.1
MGGDCAPRCRTYERARFEGRGGDCAPRCNAQRRAKYKTGGVIVRAAARKACKVCKSGGGACAPRCRLQKRA